MEEDRNDIFYRSIEITEEVSFTAVYWSQRL